MPISFIEAEFKNQKYIYFFLLLSIVLAHVNISYFIPNFLNIQFFVSCLTVLLFLAQLNRCIRRVSSFQFNRIDLIVLFFYGYVFLNNLFLSTYAFSEDFINFSAIFCVYFIVRQQKLTNHVIFKYLKITALLIISIETIYCFLQWKNIIPNLNSNYQIGGSYGHPAFTAISISVLIPYLIKPLKKWDFKSTIVKILIPVGLFLLLLFSLKSRAALLSIVLSFTAIIIYPKVKHLKKLKIVVSTFFIGLIVFTVAFVKSDSSLGRIFVWKKCIDIIPENLFFGAGFGRFTFEYNKYQSLFFSKLIHPNKEAFLADYSESAFNEFLQFGVEMGLTGLAFLLILLGCFFYFKKQTNNAEYFFNAILCSFIPLFLGWSVLRYFPIGCFFFIGIALLSKQIGNKLIFSFKVKSKKIKNILLLFVIFLAILFLHNRANYLLISWSVQNDKKLNYSDNLRKAFPKLQYSDSHVYKCCDFLIRNNEYKQAAFVAEKSSKWLNSPALYHYLYKIHLEQKEYSKVVKDLDYLINISPSKIYPKYALAKLYYSTGNKIKGDSLAEKILTTKPKVMNADVILMREELKTYLKN